MNQNKSGKKGRKLPQEVEEIINWAVNQYYLFPASEIWGIILERIEDENKKRDIEDYLQVPSISTIKKRILSISEAKIGAKKKIVDLVDKATYPLQKARVYHTGLEVVAIDEKGLSLGRPFLSVVIDEFSGYPLGYSLGFEQPSYKTVKLAIHHAISTKSYIKEKYPELKNFWKAYGVMESLIHDERRGVLSESFAESCFNVGIVSLEYRPSSLFYLNELEERLFRTLHQELKLPNEKEDSATHSETKEANPIYSKWVATMDFLHETIHFWLIDKYAQTFNEKYGGTPAMLWNENEPFQWELPFDRKISLFPKSEGRIQRTGIRFQNLSYQSVELQKFALKFKDKRMVFHYNPNDMSAVYVFDSYRKEYLSVPCVNQEY